MTCLLRRQAGAVGCCESSSNGTPCCILGDTSTSRPRGCPPSLGSSASSSSAADLSPAARSLVVWPSAPAPRSRSTLGLQASGNGSTTSYDVGWNAQTIFRTVSHSPRSSATSRRHRRECRPFAWQDDQLMTKGRQVQRETREAKREGRPFAKPEPGPEPRRRRPSWRVVG